MTALKKIIPGGVLVSPVKRKFSVLSANIGVIIRIG